MAKLSKEDRKWTIVIFACLTTIGLLFGLVAGMLIVKLPLYYGEYAYMWVDSYNWDTIPHAIYVFIDGEIAREVWFGGGVGAIIGAIMGFGIAIALELRNRIKNRRMLKRIQEIIGSVK